MLLVFTLLVGCNSNGETLRVGSYNDRGDIIFQKDDIRDQETIDEVKKLLNPEEEVEAPSDGAANRVIQINNKQDSTMVMNVSLWTEDISTVTFLRGHLDDEEKTYYQLSEESWNRIKELLNL